MKQDRDVKQVKGKRGGAVKKAPEGYYTAGEAQRKLGLNASTFGYYVRKGKIKKFVPPMRTEGFYDKKEIDQIANEIALFLHTKEEPVKTETRPATEKDAEGIVKILTMRGWKTTTPEQRIRWYQVNPFIDYVVVSNNEVMGYIHAVPFTDKALSDMMSGKKRSWDMQPEDILPYEPGKTYDIYIGIATNQDVPNHTQRFGFRLIAGFLSFLRELATQQIVINRVYALSAEPEGQKLSKDLGFVEQKKEEGDLFPRFVLDLRTSDSHFAKLYRETIEKNHKRANHPRLSASHEN